MYRRVLSSSVVVLVAVALLPVPIGAQNPAIPRVTLKRNQGFQTGIDVVSLAVTVTDPRSQLIGNLQREDFDVSEDGIKQDLAYFETGDVPLDLALLIDTSASMEGKLGFVRKAATGFTNTLRPGDRASVIGFNNRVNVLQPFTEDIGSIRRAIEKINANGGTALYNALYITLKEYARDLRKDDIVRRRAIVLLTDGEDTASLLSFDELLREARREAITVYTIGMRGEILTAQSKEKHFFGQTDFSLRALAQETGALAFFPMREGELSVAYQAISKELAEQYAIGYVSKNPIRDGQYRKVVVQIANKPELRPRTRSGYLADTLRMASVAPEQ